MRSIGQPFRRPAAPRGRTVPFCLLALLLLSGCRSSGKLASVPGLSWLSPGQKEALLPQPHDPTIDYPAPSAAEVPATLSSGAGRLGAVDPRGRSSLTAPANYPSTGLSDPVRSPLASLARSPAGTARPGAGPADAGHLASAAAGGGPSADETSIIPPRFSVPAAGATPASPLGQPQQGPYRVPGQASQASQAPRAGQASAQQNPFSAPPGVAAPSYSVPASASEPLAQGSFGVPPQASAWSPPGGPAADGANLAGGTAAAPIPAHDAAVLPRPDIALSGGGQSPAPQALAAASQVPSGAFPASAEPAAAMPPVGSAASGAASAYAPQRVAGAWLPGSTSQLSQQR